MYTRAVIDLTPQEQGTISTYDKIAHEYAVSRSKIILWKPEMNLLKDLLPTGHLLEIGAGSGRDCKELIKLGYKYTGIEPSGGLLAIARQQNPDARFDHNTLYDLNYKEKFDGFWCTAVLLHVPRNRIDEALQTIGRNLKSGAIGFITIKEGIGEQVRIESEDPTSRLFFTYWDTESFKAVLHRNGYEVLREGRRIHLDVDWLTYHVRVT